MHVHRDIWIVKAMGKLTNGAVPLDGVIVGENPPI